MINKVGTKTQKAILKKALKPKKKKEEMKIGSIKLLTNNPRKTRKLKELGVQIDDTVAMVVPETNPFNHRYLEAKHDRMDHQNLKQLFEPKALHGTIVGETYIAEKNGQEMAANAIEMSLAKVDETEEDEEAGEKL